MSGEDIVTLRAGEPTPPVFAAVAPSYDGFRCAIGTCRPLAMFGYINGTTRQQRRALQHGTIRLGLLQHGCAALVVAGIDGIGQFDMPYDHAAVPDELRGLPNRKPHQGYGVEVVVFDTATNLVAVTRLVSVTPQFAERVDAVVADLDRRLAAGPWTYDADVAEVYRKHQDASGMFHDAIIVERAGMPFPRAGHSDSGAA